MTANNISNPAELFQLLESNKLEDVESIKKIFHDHFLSTKDGWLVNGLLDYFLSTNSTRVVEVLSGVREPHDKHLFDKLLETIVRSEKNNVNRMRVLTLLGHVARRQPTWLYKLASHPLFKQLLQLLKEEKDPLPLISALLLLVTLLPMLPTALIPHLQDIFEVFSRLAAFYYQQSCLISTSMTMPVESYLAMSDKDQFYLLHLQIGLHNLFHRLYAMYPNNFLHFLNQRYSGYDQRPIFNKTIGPLLESVKMHPLLVITSKEKEISSARWKKMEHHDVVVECGRFAIDRCKEESLSYSGSRFTPVPDYSYINTPVNHTPGLTVSAVNGEEDTFWSPSMMISPHSPTPLQTPDSRFDARSAPSTPGARTRTSPPEAAIEATPETTPVKDSRQLPNRPLPVGSSAVRALGGFGNGMGGNSRPLTPTPLNLTSVLGSGDNSYILSQKLGKVMADRQNAAAFQHPISSRPISNEDLKSIDTENLPNGKNDSWKEDQEVSEIVSSGKSIFAKEQDKKNTCLVLSRKIQTLRLCSKSESEECLQGNRTKSCPDIKMEGKVSLTQNPFHKSFQKKSDDRSTQTNDGIPYEFMLLDIMEQKTQSTDLQNSLKNSEFSRLSPSAMLEHYIEVCARSNSFSDKTKSGLSKQKVKRKDDETGNGTLEDDNIEADRALQQIQLMKMQLQFERQRREVHAERNRRLLGKLRDSRELEEKNSALSKNLEILSSEMETLKKDLDQTKKNSRSSENKHVETSQYWQSKCKEEQQINAALKDKIELLELELKNEKKRVVECEKQTKAAQATLFEAVHQLKEALKAANKSEELKRVLDSVQKRFLLLGEAQSRLMEKMDCGPSNNKAELTLANKSHAEELSSLRRQLETQCQLVEALKARVSDFEHKDARKEIQLVDQQRLLLEAKERHEAELEAVDSKYRAQVEINLLLEGRILELHGKLETATLTASCSAAAVNLGSSASPKERSPPLSASLASSSEGSLAFAHSGPGIIMNDSCDPGAEIPNLQAIVDNQQSTAFASSSNQAGDNNAVKSPTKAIAKNRLDRSTT